MWFRRNHFLCLNDNLNVSVNHNNNDAIDKLNSLLSILGLTAIQYSWCTSKQFVGYMRFHQCKQHCLNLGSSCHGIIYPRNYENWCYWCPSAQQAYSGNSNYWDLTMCVWKVSRDPRSSLSLEKKRKHIFDIPVILPQRSWAIVTVILTCKFANGILTVNDNWFVNNFLLKSRRFHILWMALLSLKLTCILVAMILLFSEHFKEDMFLFPSISRNPVDLP